MRAIKSDSPLVSYVTLNEEKDSEIQFCISALSWNKILLEYQNTLTSNDYDWNKSNWQLISLIEKE